MSRNGRRYRKTIIRGTRNRQEKRITEERMAEKTDRRDEERKKITLKNMQLKISKGLKRE